jgi:arylformamidase
MVFKSPYIIEFEAAPGTLITSDHFVDHQYSELVDIVIFKTGFEKWREEKLFWKHSPGIAGELAELLMSKYPNLRAIGMDFISISSQNHKEEGRKAHKEFLQKGILIFEDLRLSEIQTPTQLQEVIALQLCFEQGDGAPCFCYRSYS